MLVFSFYSAIVHWIKWTQRCSRTILSLKWVFILSAYQVCELSPCVCRSSMLASHTSAVSSNRNAPVLWVVGVWVAVERWLEIDRTIRPESLRTVDFERTHRIIKVTCFIWLIKLASRKPAESHWKGILFGGKHNARLCRGHRGAFSLSCPPLIIVRSLRRWLWRTAGTKPRPGDTKECQWVQESMRSRAHRQAATSSLRISKLQQEALGVTEQFARNLCCCIHTHWRLFLLKHTLTMALCDHRFISGETNSPSWWESAALLPVQENSRHF